MGHQIAWIEEELIGISKCDGKSIPDGEFFTVDIYDYFECPVCHKKVKLRQRNYLVDEQGNEVD